VRLYVNGVLAAEVSGATPFQANGSLTVGRALWGGQQADKLHGKVDEVAVWQGAMSAREIAGLYRQTTTDTAPPLVMATSPGSNASGVPTGSNVMVTFNEPVSPSTVNGTNVVLTGPGGATVPATVSYESGDGSVSIIPTTGLSTNTQYRVTVKGGSAGVTDPAGNAMASDTVFSFTTAGNPVVLGNNGGGPDEDAGDQNWINGSRFTVGAAPMSITQMGVLVGAVAASPNNQFQLAIYTDSSGSPGTLVASSTSGTLSSSYSWYTRPVTATLAANTSYWLVYNTNGANNMMYAPGAAGQGAYGVTGQSFGTWPASFGAAVTGTWRFAIYAQ
jgi:hypothetical protein